MVDSLSAPYPAPITHPCCFSAPRSSLALLPSGSRRQDTVQLRRPSHGRYSMPRSRAQRSARWRIASCRRQGGDVLEHARGRLGVTHRHRVHRRVALQGIAEHVGLDRGAERYVQPDALLARGHHELGEPLAERAVHDREGAVPHAVADRHFHEAGGGGGPHQYRAPGAAQGLQPWRHARKQLLHPGRAVADHRAQHRREHVGVDVGGTGEEELPERRRRMRRHAVARASCSTSPPTTTSLVFTRRTPSSPHSFSSVSAPSRSIGFIASVTANTRVWGRCCSKPSISYLSHTSRSTPYSTTSCRSGTSNTARTLSFVKTSKRCLWNRMSPR